MAFLSVVIPVYNVEKYLEQCLISIQAQTFRDFEVILVDDGSTDSSGAICDQYATNDSRFVVHHKANGGVSSARNDGLSKTSGEWITFIDSDDWVDPSYFDNMICAANSIENADVVVNTRVTQNDGNHAQEIIWNDIDVKALNKENSVIPYLLHAKLPASMCSYMFRRDVIGCNLVDTSIHHYEDIDFLMRVLSRNYRYCLNSQGGYHYRQGSVTHSKLTDKTMSGFKMVDKWLNFGLTPELEKYLLEMMIFSVAMVAAKDRQHDKKYDLIIKKRAQSYFKIKNEYKPSFVNSLHIRLMAISPKVFYSLYRAKHLNES